MKGWTPLIMRRTVLGGGFVLFGAAASGYGLRPNTDKTSGPEAFGAVGDGNTDDTAALQAWLDAGGDGARMTLVKGHCYRIDTAWRPTFGNYGGLKLRRGQTLVLNGAELRALPSAFTEGAVVQGYKTDDWQVIGPGTIIGDRSIHRGKSGEWGMGIAAWSASGWRINDVTITDCWGDGIVAGYAPDSIGTFCENFVIEGGRISLCRRNGISIVAGRRGRIGGIMIRAIAGTSPQAGIDLEPDNPNHPNEQVLITDVDIADANLGIAVTVANRMTTITRSRIDAGNSGVMIGDGARNLVIIDNPMIRSHQGGGEGGAIRTAAGDNGSIDGVSIRNNDLAGGGLFVIDFAAGAHNIAVVSNRIIASNAASRIARLFTGSIFNGNECTVTANAGVKGGFIVQLVETAQTGNSYRNRSPFKMPPLLVRTR